MMCVSPQSPPYAVTEEKRREAEAIFMDLKKTQRPYDSCKFILGEVSLLQNLYFFYSVHENCGYNLNSLLY